MTFKQRAPRGVRFLQRFGVVPEDGDGAFIQNQPPTRDLKLQLSVVLYILTLGQTNLGNRRSAPQTPQPTLALPFFLYGAVSSGSVKFIPPGCFIPDVVLRV